MAGEPRQQPPRAGTGQAAGPADDAQPAIQFLAGAVRRIASSLDLRETLQEVVQAVVDHLGFGAAAINLARPGDAFEVVAAAGPPDVADALLGTRASMETWQELLAACEPWGELRFLDYRSDQRAVRAIARWIPPVEPGAGADAWHPDDVLLAPLRSASGSLVGVLSVDLPQDGRRPGTQRRELLEQFAAYAAVAIENSRVHTLVASSEQLFRAMFDRSPIAIALLTEDKVVTRVNPAYERLTGRGTADLVGKRADELTPPVKRRRRTDVAGTAHDQFEVHFTRRDGAEVWGRVNYAPLAGDIAGENLILAQIEDLTLLRLAQARLAHDATHDTLTGLANRALAMERLEAALKEPGAAGQRVAVLFCDVDHFKEVNDTLGHAAGDQLLASIARGLQAAVRAHDTVGRIGGDEFVVVAYPVRGEAEAVGLAERVIRKAELAAVLDGGPLPPSLSIGVALSVPADNADTLLAAADQALYRAKLAGRGQWELAARLPGRGERVVIRWRRGGRGRRRRRRWPAGGGGGDVARGRRQPGELAGSAFGQDGVQVVAGGQA